MGSLPASRPLRIRAELGNCVIHDLECALRQHASLPNGMRHLVDSEQHHERELRVSAAHSTDRRLGDVAVYLEPLTHLAAKMRHRCPRDEAHAATDAILWVESTP